MGTEEILHEINKLPANQRLTLIELTIQNLRKEEKTNKLSVGADAIHNDYVSNRKLVVFGSV